MVPLKDRPNYRFVRLILETDKAFTPDEFIKAVRSADLRFEEGDIILRLEELRRAGVLRKSGVRYKRTELIVPKSIEVRTSP